MKITVEPLEFPLCVKEKLLKIPKISKLHIEFVNGKNIDFNKTNLSIYELLESLSKFYNIPRLTIEKEITCFITDKYLIFCAKYDKLLLKR